MSEPSRQKPNRLIDETSPYLQQHAYNPVDWYPWGEEALARSRQLDRPIFLSVGYSSCHWCHVMERESFENETIAKLLNEHFVSIKVDREERPEIDAIYMQAVQMLTGSGGWPMSVFLTPELKPFWGGTYFPPESRHGRAGFGHILTQLAEVYRGGREKVEETARQIVEHLAEPTVDSSQAELPAMEAMVAAVDHARRTFDPAHGGFGSAPKFPRSIEISKLLRHHARTRDAHSLEMCEVTLEKMALGGMYDQIGGGFHRYSTDERWLVPHFEKMLYDNALLARTYLEAFQLTGKELYAGVARDIFDYLLREMTSPDGGFYSATDADSEGEEGKFFVWTPAEVVAVAGAEDARVACEYYNITREGNFEHSRSIPNVPRSLEVVAKLLRIDPAQARESLRRSRQALYQARDSRVKPFRDEKILSAWNGLMISALARGGKILGEDRFCRAAEQAASFLFTHLCVDGKLHRTHKDGRTQFPGYLDDHAYVAEACLDLYEASFDLIHLTRAQKLMDCLLQDFWDTDSGGFFFTSVHHEALIARRKDNLDNATPSSNGVAALNLLRLERLTGLSKYRARAVELFKSVKLYFDRAPMAMSSTLIALDFLHHPPVEIALVGDLDGVEGQALLRCIWQKFLPSRVLVAARVDDIGQVSSRLPLLAGKAAVGGKPTAHVCRELACQAPVSDAPSLAALLSS